MVYGPGIFPVNGQGRKVVPVEISETGLFVGTGMASYCHGYSESIS